MTKSQIINRVSELIQDNSGTMQNLIRQWVDLVLLDISSRGYLRSLQTEEMTPIVTQQNSYTLGVDTDQVESVYVPAWGDVDAKLIPLSVEDFQSKVNSDGTTPTLGRPHWYCIHGGNIIRLWPTPRSDDASTNDPATQLHVLKYRNITLVGDTTDITEIKPKFMPTIIFGTYVYGARFDKLGDLPEAEARYENGLRALIGDTRMELNRAQTSRYRDL